VTAAPDPLFAVLRAAADGRPPDPDGSLVVLPAPSGPRAAVVGFPFHAIVAADVDEHMVTARIDPADPCAPLKAPFLIWLAGRLGVSPGSIDVVLVRRGPAPDEPIPLTQRADLDDHPRVLRAARYRTDPRVYTDETGAGVLIVGRGLAGRWEVAFEVDPAARGRGLGRRLAEAATGCVPDGEPVFAQVAPANATSLRAVLAAGFRPVCAEALFPRDRS
jgi:GNAT superfamily N-acetyltransferase